MNNYGFSFGLSFPWFEVVALIFWLGMIWFSYKEKSWWLGLALVGGGLNIYERWTNGFVNDYWKIPMLPIYNNLNDWLIFVGIGAYLWKKLK